MLIRRFEALRPAVQALLHQLKDLPTIQLRVLLSDGLLQLEEEALAAEATHTRLTMVRAARSGSADQFLGREHRSPSAFRGHTRDRLSR